MGTPVRKCKKKRKAKKKPAYKCQKVARLTCNGYLNFLREFKKKCCGLSPQEMVRRGARAWNELTCEEKEKYKQMYFKQKSKSSNKKKSGQSCRCSHSLDIDAFVFP
ncbi:protamine-like protein 99C [Drosophila willistoni]|uniref:protamine-like protein 99C n=1 Tax=Drosophila willistoni TaxID=7260 RepID=UPI000C26C792|nr:protamine-like protein 99C [Drosophila willistoni]